ncbi:AAA family ATPase, partial [Candidatus Oleimmundimicrobium sp.]|uniref:Lon protease family protein n=1 Tax=Candidatus Oleimmundimicrobium sp. TaxID=3060597 RepID=UPI00271EF109
MTKKLELSFKELKKVCNVDDLDFKTTEELPPLDGTIGQERAVDALEFGLDIKTKDFNIYVSGLSGTGKDTTVKAYVKHAAEKGKVPSDWCYVHNFEDSRFPIAVELSPGKGQKFSKDMNELVKNCKETIPKAFESEAYERKKEEIIDKFQFRKDALLKELKNHARKVGFAVQFSPGGVTTLPLIDGKSLTPEKYDKLSEERKKEIQEESEQLKSDLGHSLKKLRNMEKGIKDLIYKLDKETVLFTVGHLIEDLKNEYRDNERIVDYLEKVQQDIVNNHEDFSNEKKPLIPLPGFEIAAKPSFEKYTVNVLVDNSKTRGAPVVIETNPTYYNLFGQIEYQVQFGGAMITDFMMVKPGAVHRANGGYLVVRALDVLTSYMAWDALKRTLRSRKATIENIGEQFRIFPASTLKPEPIPLDIKIVMVGNPYIYYLLYNLDEDFRKLFKVKSDFDVEMKRSGEYIKKYAEFVSAICRKEGLKHFDSSAVARIVEYGSWLVGHQNKLSTRFMEVADLVNEASFWAEKNGNKYVTAKDVQRAIDKKTYRSNMIEDKIQELIEDGTILMDTEGSVVGQVNGLSIVFLGDYFFGKPSKITARVSMGKGEVVDIEREVEMSGPVHSKGVMILDGYLRGNYALDKPLSVSISLGFEQLYEGVEGDSASSAELYAILSALSNISIKQNLAVTGSVNQHGKIQAIGGVNKKIEGFFDICKLRGLTSDQ